MSKTPDDIVAEEIFKKVSQAELLRKDDLKGFEKKLKEGLLTEEDWRLFAEGKDAEGLKDHGTHN